LLVMLCYVASCYVMLLVMLRYVASYVQLHMIRFFF